MSKLVYRPLADTLTFGLYSYLAGETQNPTIQVDNLASSIPE